MLTPTANDHLVSGLDLTDHGEGHVFQHLLDAVAIPCLDFKQVTGRCLGKGAGDLIGVVSRGNVVETDLDSMASGERHFSGGDQQAAFTEIMRRPNEAFADQIRHRSGVSRTRFEIDSRKRLVLQVRQNREMGTTECRPGLSDQKQQVAG